MANHLALAATLDPGDEALVEHPTYELLVSTLQYLGVDVRYFERRMENDFRVDPEEVERQMTPRTRLIVLTNLHNPTGALIDQATLARRRRNCEAARRARAGGRSLSGGDVRAAAASAIHLGDHFLVTSSLTKGFGLSGLRCGWILANPELAERMWHINDLVWRQRSASGRTAECDRARQSRPCRGASESIAGGESPCAGRVSCNRATTSNACVPEFGTVAFPRLRSGSVDALDRLLREKYETSSGAGQLLRHAAALSRRHRR